MAVNLLLSYAFHSGTKLSDVRRDLVCGRLMIDSGAFTAWTKGYKIDVDEYAEFLERWRGCWDHAITLDVIGDGTASARNTRKLHERGLPVMPVFTRGDTLADFDAMVAEVGYVCVGGLVGLPVKTQLARVRMLQRRAQDAGGGIHALGIGSMATLRAARPYSADASSVSGAFRFGTLVYFDGQALRNVSLADRKKLARDRDHLRAHGMDLGELARSQRMPKQAQRPPLMRAMSLAYAAADEYLKRTGPVPPPGGMDQDGTHLFNSVSVNGGHSGPHAEWRPAAGLDRELHQGTHLYSSIPRDTTGVKVTAKLDRELHSASDGTHLYNSLTPGFTLAPAAGLDRELHASGPAGEAHPSEGSPSPAAPLPSIWRVHGRTHQCRAIPTRSPEPEEAHHV